MTNEVIQNILTRCSVRAYDDRPVEREKIDMLLQCAVHAPSAMNRQTWHFSAVLNREKIAKLTAAVGKALGNEKYDMYKPAALHSVERADWRHGYHVLGQRLRA